MDFSKISKFVVSIDNLNGCRITSFFSSNKLNPLDFTRVGVDGRELNSIDYYNLGVKKSFPPLSPSELGCTLSHLEILAKFMESDNEYALILEDDVIFKNDINFENIDIVLLKSNFVFLLGGVDLTLCKNLRGKNFLFSGINVLKVNKKFRRFLYYTMGYIVDRKAAERILSYHKDGCKKADDWAGLAEEYPDIQFYITDLLEHPDIDQITNGNSSIGNERLHHFFYVKLGLKLFMKIILRRLDGYRNMLFFKKFKG